MGEVYGVIGVGAIARAIITGLSEDDAPKVLLSPRNATVAGELAERYSNVQIVADNQAVIDGASVLLLCLRPQDARGGLDNLTFRADQPVVSTMAGVSVRELADLVAPATEIARSIPLPAVSLRQGVTPLYPATPSGQALFDRLGETIALDDEDAFDALSASTATVSAYFAYLGAVAEWLARQGIPQEAATRYVTTTFAGLTGALESGHGFDALAKDHATPGGINEQFARDLREAGMFDVVEHGLDRVFERLLVRRQS